MFMPRECKDNVTAAFILKLRFHRLATFKQALAYQFFRDILLSIEWNSIRLSGPAHGIVTKTVHKTLLGGGGGRGWCVSGGRGVVGSGVVGVRG